MEHEPNVSPWFWDILEAAAWSLQALRARLAQMTEDELRAFCQMFDEAKGYVDPCHWSACHPYLTRPCTEDYGDDFAAWVVMEGQAFYGQVRARPDGIMEYLVAFAQATRTARLGRHIGRWMNDDPSVEFRGLGRGDYLANRIHRSRTGNDLELW